MTPAQALPGNWLIYGARGFAHTVAALIGDIGGRVLVMIEDGAPADRIGAVEVMGSLAEAVERFRGQAPAIAMGIGYRNLPARREAWVRVRASGLPTPPLVHPQAYVSRTAVLAPGVLVMARAIVDRDARLGEASVLWPGACVNHESVIGANCFISPNATICGASRVGADSFVGAGAMVADECDVPDGSFLRMGERFTRRCT